MDKVGDVPRSGPVTTKCTNRTPVSNIQFSIGTLGIAFLLGYSHLIMAEHARRWAISWQHPNKAKSQLPQFARKVIEVDLD
jgi:hypothetical protein